MRCSCSCRAGSKNSHTHTQSETQGIIYAPARATHSFSQSLCHIQRIFMAFQLVHVLSFLFFCFSFFIHFFSFFFWPLGAFVFYHSTGSCCQALRVGHSLGERCIKFWLKAELDASRQAAGSKQPLVLVRKQKRKQKYTHTHTHSRRVEAAKQQQP